MVRSANLACRPLQPMAGGFMLDLTVQAQSGFRQFEGWPGFREAGKMTWCGSQSWLGFGETASRFSTALRLPRNLSVGDCFPLTITWVEPISISARIQAADEEQALAFDLEMTLDEPAPEFVCADPSVMEPRIFRDPIASGACGMPSRSTTPICAVEPLRVLADSANLGVQLQRVGGKAGDYPVQIITIVGDMRRLAIIPEKAPSASVEFPLDASNLDAKWPLVLRSDGPVEWSASIYRGFDIDFRPAFTIAGLS